MSRAKTANVGEAVVSGGTHRVGDDGRGGAEFDQLRPYRAFETIVDAVRERIADHRLTTGQRLPPERDLAGQFGVSRATLREAFRVLESMGLIESRMGSGRYVVGRQSGDPAADTFLGEHGLLPFVEFLLGIEPYLASLAASRATAADLARIEATLAPQPGTRQQEAATDTSFHLAVTDAAHNSVARDVLKSERVALYWADLWVSVLPASHEAIVAEHRSVYNAIAGRDADEARSAMTRHLEAAFGRIREASLLRGDKGDRQGPS